MTNEQKKEFNKWVDSANDDWQTAEFMLQGGRYVWALYILQLSIEKLIKALVIKHDKLPYFTHDLKHLYEQIGDIPQKYLPWIKEITSFNISARYDIEKQKLHKKATKKYTKEWFKKGEELKQWLIQQLN